MASAVICTGAIAADLDPAAIAFTLPDKIEWKGTKVVFEISRKGDQTEIHFTHEGLVPAYECYSLCSDAWGRYIRGSLKSLISTGKGSPNPKEKAK